MDFESEAIAQEFLPAARSLLAEQLSEEYGLYQEEIAEIMGITQAAVSQYLNKKRASKKLLRKMKDDPQIMLLLNEAAGNAAREEAYLEEFRQILETVKAKGLMKQSFEDVEKL
ncbi:MAG: transcriptional regulator [Candidatus Nanohaloarchaea archaeon]